MPRHTSPCHTARSLLLGCSLFMGCSTNTPLPADARQQLGKVYLNSAGETKDTYLHGDFKTGGFSGALSGAGKAAYDNLNTCVGNAAGAAQLAPLVLLICTPIMVPVGLVAGSKTGSHPVVTQEAVDNMTQQTNDLLKKADLSGALVNTLDEVGQQNHRLADYELTHGTLPAPEKNENIYQMAARWGYQTVMDVQVIAAGFDSDKGRVPMLHLSMTARIKLVNTADGSVIKQQDYDYASRPEPYKYWFDENHTTLNHAVIDANTQLAHNIVDDVFIK